MYMLRQRGWLAGCLSVTRWYCIKTAKPILKLFWPSGSPIILVSSNPAPIPNSKGNPFNVGYKYTGVGKWRFSVEICLSRKPLLKLFNMTWLLWNVNRKSWMPDWMVSSSSTLSDLRPDFKVATFLTLKISETTWDRAIVTIERQ